MFSNQLNFRLAIHKPAKQALIDALNAVNAAANFTVDDFAFDVPQVNDGNPIDCNTKLLMIADPELGFIGSLPIWYNRIDISTVFDNTTSIVVSPADSKISHLIPAINTAFKIELTADDYVDTDLPQIIDFSAPIAVTLQIKPGSLLFIGSAQLKLGNWGLNPAEFTAVGTDIFLANCTNQISSDSWVKRYDFFLKPIDWNVANDQHTLLASRISAALVRSAGAVFLRGELNYDFTAANGISETVSKEAVAIIDGVIIDLNATLTQQGLVQSFIANLSIVGQLKCFAFMKGSHADQVIASMHVVGDETLVFDILFKTNATLSVVAIKSANKELGVSSNEVNSYIDFQPIFYNNIQTQGLARYAQFVITSSSFFIRFLNGVFELISTLPVLALAPIVANTSFYTQFKPNHFSFTAIDDGHAGKILISVKQPSLLCDPDVNVADGFSAFEFSVNGASLKPFVGDGESCAWFGVFEVSADGVVLPSKFTSTVSGYRTAWLPEDVCSKSSSPVLQVKSDNSGYTALRFRRNPVYGQRTSSVYPCNFTSNGQAVFRGINEYMLDHQMVQVFDAKAQEVFYHKDGIKLSRGFIWYVLGIANTSRENYIGDFNNTVSLMIFDANARMVACRQSELEDNVATVTDYLWTHSLNVENLMLVFETGLALSQNPDNTLLPDDV